MDVVDALILDNEPFELGRAADWLDGLLGDAGAPPRVVAALQVALEEVLNNILCFGYADLETHKIEVRFAVDATAATLEISDDGIEFDPTRHTPASASETTDPTTGGLGLLFVRRLMDEVTFERVGDRNHLTLRKFMSL
jgi:serine/threonine-protein kinase RsbW